MDFNRSAFLASAAALSVASAIPLNASAARQDDPDHPAVGSAASALKRLKAGNERFSHELPIRPPYQVPYGKDQAPFASLVVCADSRVAPELVFDEGLDQLFVCRVAGNIVPAETTGSIQFAVAKFHTPLVVVLGHSACGACNETITALDTGKMPAPDVDSVVKAILPAARRIPRNEPLEKRRALLVQENARVSAAHLRTRLQGAALVVYGVHDLVSGEVTFH